MFVYSGECRMCECGLNTEIFDSKGTRLKTGDVVLIWTEGQLGPEYMPDSLTVVISKQYQSYSNGVHELLPKPHAEFIMGIADVDLKNSEWRVVKIKDCSDVVDGEHWRAFGFNYKQE